MAKNNNLTDFLTNLANKFRSKLGSSSKINPQNFESLIDDVYTKGYGDAPSGTDVSDTTASQSDVLNGKEFYNSSGTKVEGTMANNGSLGTTTLTASSSSKTIPEGYTSGGTVKINTTNLSAKNIKADVSILGVEGTFTSDATAGSYDICDGKTAYVDGSKITGAYETINIQINSSSTNCSTRTLKFSCPFQPKYLAIVFNSENYGTSKVISCYAVGTAAIVYHTKTSISVARTQITSGVSSYWSYSNGIVTVNSPSSSYLWTNYNYRLFAFK